MKKRNWCTYIFCLDINKWLFLATNECPCSTWIDWRLVIIICKELCLWHIFILANKMFNFARNVYTKDTPKACSRNSAGWFSDRASQPKGNLPCFKIQSTVIIWSIETDRAEQTAQTQIRLLLKEQSDQGLLCLLFCLHLLNTIQGVSKKRGPFLKML